MSTPSTEASRRRTFAIISHPDAGKTTLTEKFLLYGGALSSEAGAVKASNRSLRVRSMGGVSKGFHGSRRKTRPLRASVSR